MKEIDLAIVADLGTLQRLPSIVGDGVARELIYTAREFDAAEAARIGLLSACEPDPAALMARVRDVARAMAAKSPLAMRGVKDVLHYSREHGVAEGLARVAALNATLLQAAGCDRSGKRPAREAARTFRRLSAAPRASGMSDRALLWLVAGCMSLQPLSTDLYLGSLPHLARYFGVPASAAQLTLTIFVIGFGLAQLIAGPLSVRFGRRPVAPGGCALYVAASVMCAAAPVITLLIGGRLLQAIGCHCVIVAARTIIRDRYTPAAGAAVIARASSILVCVPLFGPITGGYTQVWFGWRAAFMIHTGFALVLAAASLRWLEETHVSPDRAALQPRRVLANYARVAAGPEFWAYALPGALSYAAIFVFIAGSSFAFIEVLHVPTERYGLCFALAVCGYLLGTLLCRRLLGRRGLPRVLRHGTGLTALGGVALCAAVYVGTAFGLLHDGSLRPLASLAAVVGMLALAAGRLPRAARPKMP